MNTELKNESYEILHTLYGSNSDFRDGQYEAIEETMTKKRTLVVQKTGWGKSLVYFVCTKLLRKQGKGTTFVISPLLVLMENQIQAANKLGLRCEQLNSTTAERRSEIIQSLKDDKIDLLLITPETLFLQEVQEAIHSIRIGLFVIDEAHCISDWGHDFRLKYSNLYKVIKSTLSNIPILATTATANDRVVEDLKVQLGEDVFVSRGPLTRESLAIQVVKMKDRADRYAWILKNINKLPGTGIIYCLTQRDCDYLSSFLNKNGISSAPYYSRSEKEEQNRIAIEKFSKNKIKVIVATIKLGMGYDKGDIGFVIHFQKPANIVTYYQQIGRAGRNIDKAYAILLSGEEDDNITEYFIETAFPSRDECEQVYGVIGGHDGIRLGQISSYVNKRKSNIEKTLNFLENERAIYKEKNYYYITTNKYEYNEKHYEEIKAIRRREKEQIKDLVEINSCYSKFVVNCLDDDNGKNCGKCANCLGHDIFNTELSNEERSGALEYLNSLTIPIEPRKMWATTSITPKASKIKPLNEIGICLSKYGDPGYGELVKKGKYIEKRFSDELVGKSAKVLSEKLRGAGYTHITCVPSLRSDIVEDFAKRLAQSLKLEFVSLIDKSEAKVQKEMENSSFQCYNAQKSFSVKNVENFPEKIILVDDVIDSKWTLTVCGYKLMEKGVQCVFPFALADSSSKEL
ncbi:MAG: RecQ family ATP-dependent DNA helicase [Bacillota bacterium]